MTEYTPLLSLPFPTPDLPVAAGADDMRALAEATEKALTGHRIAVVRTGTSNYTAGSRVPVPFDSVSAELSSADWADWFRWNAASRLIEAVYPGLYLAEYQSAAAVPNTIAGIQVAAVNAGNPATVALGQSGKDLGGMKLTATCVLDPRIGRDSLRAFLQFPAGGSDAANTVDNPHYLSLTWIGAA